MFLLISAWLFAIMVLSKLGEKTLSPSFDWLVIVYNVSFYALLLWCVLVFVIRVSFVIQLARWRKALTPVDDVIEKLYAFPAWKKAILGVPLNPGLGASGAGGYGMGYGDGGTSAISGD